MYGFVPVMSNSQAKHNIPSGKQRPWFLPITCPPAKGTAFLSEEEINSSLPTFLPLTEKIPPVLLCLFRMQSSQMPRISCSLVTQGHPVFLGVHLVIREISWALEEIAYGDQTNTIIEILRAILRVFKGQIKN